MTMKELIDYILQFGSLNQQQIDLVSSKGRELELSKDQYFQKQEKLSGKSDLLWKVLSAFVTITTRAKK